MEVQKNPAFLSSFLELEIYKIEPHKEAEISKELPGVFGGNILENSSADVAVISNGSNSVKEIEFLSKVLHAVNLTLEKVALYKVEEVDETLMYFIEKSPATKVLVFGFEFIRENSSKLILQSATLAQLMKNTELKRELWNRLKQMF